MNELARLLSYVRRYLPSLLVAVLLMAFAGGAQALIARLIGPIFDRVLKPDAPDLPVKLFYLPGLGTTLYLHDLMPGGIHNVWTMTALAILAAFLLRGVSDYVGNYLLNRIGFSAVMDLRQQVFERVLRQGAAFFDANSTATLMSSIMNDIEKIQVATSHLLADLFRQLFVALALLFLVVQSDWKLALFSLTVLPIAAVPTAKLGRKIRRSSRAAQDQTAELNVILGEALGGHQIVKAFQAEAIEAEKFRQAGLRLRRTSLRYVMQQAIASPMIEFLGALTIVGLLTYARGQILRGQMTAGDFTAFVVALLMLYEPVKRLVGIHNIFQQAFGAAQRVFEYLDEPVLIDDAEGAQPLPPFRDKITFCDVVFTYANRPELPALRGVNLTVEAGQMVALVGPSGAGKSTLASLLLRFHDVDSGTVCIDGRDVRSVTLASLRGQIGIVAQDTFLFNDSVYDNIRYGRPEATEAEVREAARNAMALGFIEQLPNGFQTMIGERGTRLSGGQRQRIAIARALLKNAPILILDEATSHLDTESEVLVQAALANLMENRTTIVIAHRLSTIRQANQIVVLEQGRLVEQGTHEELVQAGGVYQRLHALQFAQALPADPASQEGESRDTL